MLAQVGNLPTVQHPARPGSNPPFTVADMMFICGIDIPTLLKSDSQAERIACKIFDDDFISCMDKTVG